MINPFNTLSPLDIKKNPQMVRGMVTTLSSPLSYCTPETENGKNKSLSLRGLSILRNTVSMESVLKGWVVSMWEKQVRNKSMFLRTGMVQNVRAGYN